MLTEAQSILIGGLNRVKAQEWIKAAVFCMVSGDDLTTMQMAEYIADHLDAPEEAFLNEARRISGE